MRRRFAVSFVLASALLGTAVGAQRTWIVSKDTEGVGHFTDIAPAIAAASPGGVIAVVPIPQSLTVRYSGFVVSKGISILARELTAVAGPISVGALPAGQSLVISNLEPRDPDPTRFGGMPVSCVDCPGTIHLRSVRASGSKYGRALTVARCAHVTLTDCEFSGGATWYPYWYLGTVEGWATAFDIVSSNVACLRTRMGGTMIVGQMNTVYGSSHAGTLSSSRLVLTQSQVSGASEVFGPMCTSIASPTNAIVASGAVITVTGPASVVQGGRRGGGFCLPTYYIAGIVGGGSVWIGDAKLENVTSQGMSVTLHPVPWLESSDAPPGSAVRVSMNSAQPGACVTFAGVPTAPLLIGPVGIWFAPQSSVEVDAGTVSGNRTFNVPISASSLPRGFALAFQSVLLIGKDFVASTPSVSALF